MHIVYNHSTHSLHANWKSSITRSIIAISHLGNYDITEGSFFFSLFYAFLLSINFSYCIIFFWFAHKKIVSNQWSFGVGKRVFLFWKNKKNFYFVIRNVWIEVVKCFENMISNWKSPYLFFIYSPKSKIEGVKCEIFDSMTVFFLSYVSALMRRNSFEPYFFCVVVRMFQLCSQRNFLSNSIRRLRKRRKKKWQKFCDTYQNSLVQQ